MEDGVLGVAKVKAGSGGLRRCESTDGWRRAVREGEEDRVGDGDDDGDEDEIAVSGERGDENRGGKSDASTLRGVDSINAPGTKVSRLSSLGKFSSVVGEVAALGLRGVVIRTGSGGGALAKNGDGERRRKLPSQSDLLEEGSVCSADRLSIS